MQSSTTAGRDPVAQPPDADARIAALELQVAELYTLVQIATDGLGHMWEKGRQSVLNPPPPPPRTRRLRLIPGGLRPGSEVRRADLGPGDSEPSAQAPGPISPHDAYFISVAAEAFTWAGAPPSAAWDLSSLTPAEAAALEAEMTRLDGIR